VLRAWYTARGEPADRLLVPSFVLADPWRTISTAAVPFWTFFPVQPALRALDAHLAATEPYRSVDILLFQHSVASEGIAHPQEWLTVAGRHGATARLLAIDPHRFPHDVASLGRYDLALAALPHATQPWTPLTLPAALDGLTAACGVPKVGFSL
jgi:hypothetical protein